MSQQICLEEEGRGELACDLVVVIIEYRLSIKYSENCIATKLLHVYMYIGVEVSFWQQ